MPFDLTHVAGDNQISEQEIVIAFATLMTLTNSLPADLTTNWTTFLDSNRVQCASGGTNSLSGGRSEPPPTPSFATQAASTSQASEPMVRRADGSGSTFAPSLQMNQAQTTRCLAQQ